jgi:intracellular sulfur oxidation DsrE/DsrF family protein
MARRRQFLAQMGGIAAALAVDADEMNADVTNASSSPWDTSWIDKVNAAKFRVVFNASDISDGAAMRYAGTFLDHFNEVHGTRDEQTRPVIVFRRLGTQMAFNDVLWDKQAIGAELKINDPATNAPARRNVFWNVAAGAEPNGNKLEALHRRGLISLVCNVSVGSISSGIARETGRSIDEVRAEIQSNLIPGAILVPSGIYALIRAQNAGCAYMPGT